MKKDKKSLIIILCLLIIVILLILFLAFSCTNGSDQDNQSDNKRTDQALDAKNDSPKNGETGDIADQKIIKCQNVVVGTGKTIELFSYSSGKKLRLDYRVSSSKEMEAAKVQVLYDGEYLYYWEEPIDYDGSKKDQPISGNKLKLASFSFPNDLSKTGEVIRFSSSTLSGDRLCNDWDDVDPIYELPERVTFSDTVDKNAETLFLERVKGFCELCNQAKDQQVVKTCQINLGCQ